MPKDLSKDTESSDPARQTAIIWLESMGVGRSVLTFTLFFLAIHSLMYKRLSKLGDVMAGHPDVLFTNPLDLCTVETLQQHELVTLLNTRLSSLKHLEDVMTVALQNLQRVHVALSGLEPRVLDYNRLMGLFNQSEPLNSAIKKMSLSPSSLRDMSEALESVVEGCQLIPTSDNVSPLISETSKQQS